MRLYVAISCRRDEVSCGQYLNSQITSRSGYQVEAMFLVDSEAPQDYGSGAERQQRRAVPPAGKSPYDAVWGRMQHISLNGSVDCLTPVASLEAFQM
jgi:hypothetical protein